MLLPTHISSVLRPVFKIFGKDPSFLELALKKPSAICYDNCLVLAGFDNRYKGVTFSGKLCVL